MSQLPNQEVSLQDALSSLTLEPKSGDSTNVTDNVLLGKILATRSFRRFTLADIINSSWKLKSGVRIEKLEENFFKFSFNDKRDKDSIFEQRPWSINGSHLILKE